MPLTSLVGVKALTIRDPWRKYAQARALLDSSGLRAAVVNVVWRDTAARLVDDGVKVWMFSLPEKFDDGTGNDFVPDEWMKTTALLSSVGKEIGAAGQVDNLEKGASRMTRLEKRGFVAETTARTRSGESVGIATHGGLDAFFSALGPELGAAGVVYCPEAYHYQLQDADIVGRVQRVVDKAKGFGFAGICPYVGSYSNKASRPFNTARAVRYWDTTPAELGGLMWLTHVPTGLELEAIRRWAKRKTGVA